MGGRRGSAHFHTATLQMASITAECAELAGGSRGGKMSNVHHAAAHCAVIHSFTRRHHKFGPLLCNSPHQRKELLGEDDELGYVSV